MIRQRWRITLEQLCHELKVSPRELDAWAELGVFGPRWREPRVNGRWRHITKEVVERGLIMRSLVDLGFTERAAAAAAATHERGDRTDLIVETRTNAGMIRVTVKRSEMREL